MRAQTEAFPRTICAPAAPLRQPLCLGQGPRSWSLFLCGGAAPVQWAVTSHPFTPNKPFPNQTLAAPSPVIQTTVGTTVTPPGWVLLPKDWDWSGRLEPPDPHVHKPRGTFSLTPGHSPSWHEKAHTCIPSTPLCILSASLCLRMTICKVVTAAVPLY